MRRAARIPIQMLKDFGSILKQAGISWVEDDATMHAASISYYAVFSLAPILVIALAVAGMVFNQETVQQNVTQQLAGLMGEEAAKGVTGFVQAASGAQHHGILATILGGLTLILGAIGAFVQLQDSLNHIWKVPPRSVGFARILRQRLLSFGLVVGVAVLLLASLALSAILAATGDFLQSHLGALAFVGQISSSLLSFVIISALFAAMFKFLPDADIHWRDVTFAAILTSALFTVGKQIIGLYIGQTGLSSAYGAAGSLAVLLAWVYYSAMILLFGAECAWVVATRRSRATARMGSPT